MFDDLPQSQPNTNPRPIQPPVNLPTGTGFAANSSVLKEPTMIAPQPPRPMLPAEPEDILGDIDQTVPATKGPSQPMPPLRPVMSAALPPAEKPRAKEPFFKQHKRAFTIVVAVVVVGGLAAAGWYTYQLVAPARAPQSVVNTTPEQTQQQPNQNLGTNTQIQNTNQEVSNSNMAVNTNEAAVAVDSDHDGLTDEEEALYGTNSNNPDTDTDGLTDRDEVKVFKTDPNNPDTDGDGYTDGVEVRSGFDPKGSGKLLQIQ